MSEAVVSAAKEWAKARLDRIAARRAMEAGRKEAGHCEPDENDQPCYYDKRLAIDDWCDVCKRMQPIWLEYQRAAKARGSALRKLAAAVARDERITTAASAGGGTL